MLPRIVLLLVQIAAAWFVGNWIKEIISSPLGRLYDPLVYAVIYAVIVMVVGFAGSLVLKGLRVPGATTFVVSLVMALILAALTLPFLSSVYGPIQDAVPFLRNNGRLLPLVGAVVGYLIIR